MDARARADELIAGLADDIGLPGLALDEQGLVDLEFDDGSQLSLALDPTAPGGVLILLGPLAGPTADLDRATWLELLSGAGAAGPAVALDATNDRLCLQERLDLTGIDYASFKSRLEAFMARQDHWTAVLLSRIAAAETAARRAVGGMPMH